MGINAYLKKPSQKPLQNRTSINNQKTKISESDFSKAWKEKRDNMIDIIIQKI